MKKFLKALIVFLKMYNDGFFPSVNDHISTDGSRWGFYRLNHTTESLFDIEFDFHKDGSGYFHSHGGHVRCHWDCFNNLLNRHVTNEAPEFPSL